MADTLVKVKMDHWSKRFIVLEKEFGKNYDEDKFFVRIRDARGGTLHEELYEGNLAEAYARVSRVLMGFSESSRRE